jgi:hypothetical protein
MKNLLITLLALICLSSYGKDSSIQDGDWETNSTWNKGIEPTTEDTLIISDGDSVTISSNLSYGTEVVILLEGGTLIFGCSCNNR